MEQELALDQSIHKSPGSNGKLKLLDGADYFRLFIFPSIGQQNQESVINKKTISWKRSVNILKSKNVHIRGIVGQFQT